MCGVRRTDRHDLRRQVAHQVLLPEAEQLDLGQPAGD
jgi:hypothetical protein